MTFVASIVATVVQHAIGPIRRQCGYMIFHKSNLDGLRDQRDKLEERIETVQQSIEVAERNLEVMKPDVEGWMKRAERCSEDAKCILDQYENEASKWCLKWCPNMKSRYSLSKEATKKAKEVTEIRNEGNFNTVSNPAPPPPIESTISTEGLKGFESRGRVINEIMKVLKDENENMIGICGMGGVGKTTMAKEIIRRVQQDKLFDHIVMGTITKTPNMRDIQGEIADCLGMKLDVESTGGRARKLFEKMEATRTFVVVDDIWDRLELSDIGIPNGEDYKSCKILLTSRNEEVVAGMGAKIFNAEVLTKEEAWSLFKDKAKIPHDEIGVPPIMLSKQKEVAEECGGLPLAIVCVAAALKGKEERLWGYACSQLRQSIVTNIGEEAKKVHMSLEFSYNQLVSDEAKKCFLLCSMYPEDSYILVEDLVRYGLALKLFEGTVKVDEARDAIYYMVDTLKKRYLLMDSDREEHVKMHDVIRDMALSIATKEEDPFMMRCAEALGHQLNEDKHKNYPIISIECLSKNMLLSNLELPKLSLFRLVNHSYDFLEIPDSFFQGMRNLKVVDLCHIIIHSFPTSLGCLFGLHTLSLNGCQVHGNMSAIGKMKSLEILSFRKSIVKQLPIEMGQLTQLKLLDLYGCSFQRIPPGVLSSLSNLEELYVGKVWGALSECFRELFSLSNLVTLHISLKYNELWPRNWTLKNMKNFDIWIGSHVPHRFEKGNYMLPNTLYVEGIDVPNIMESGLRIPLKISRQLCLISIRGLNNDFGEENYECLTQLTLKNCRNIEYLINARSGNPERAFPILKSLKLSSLKNFKQIYQVQSQKDSFSKVKVALTNVEELVLSFMDNLMEIWPKAFQVPLKLRKLIIEMCPRLNSVLLPSNWMQCGLKEIYVEDCQSVETIFGLQDFGHLYSIVALPVLGKLKIFHLPKLIDVWKINTISPVSFQGFQNLQSVEIEGCNNLRNQFPTCVAKLLQNLKELSIKKCRAMENIVVDEPPIHDHHVGEGTSSDIHCLFPQLEVLLLIFLPKLRSLCPQGFTFAATCLEEFTACYPPNTKQHYYSNANQVEIVPSATDIRLLNGECGLKEFYLKDCKSLEVIFDLQDFGRPHSIVALPVLDKLKILHLPKLTDVWKINTTATVSFQGFQNLQSIEIEGCNNLRNLFPSYVAKLLQNLKELRIKKCGAMENIVANEPQIHDHHDGEGTSFGIHCLFPWLEVLSLIFLPKLRSLCPQGFTFAATCLEEFTACYHPNTRQHYGGNANQVKIVPSATNIRLLNRKCGLKEVYLEDCQFLEVVFDPQDFGHPYSIVALPVLEKLKILHLPKLTDVWKINTTSPVSFQGFQNLQSIEIKGCNNLRNLFPPYVAKLLQNLKELRIKKCGAMENIVANEPQIHDHHDGEGTSFGVHRLFPRLEVLSLIFLPKLRNLCHPGFTFAGTCLKEYEAFWCPKIEQHYYGNAEKVEIIPNSTDIHLLNGKFIFLPEEEVFVERMDQDTWYKDVEVQRYLNNARTICFLSCEKLLSIASFNLMGRLHNLEAMLVGWCDSVEAMFDFEGFDHEELLVGLLSELRLIFLPKLIHIWKNAPQQSHYYFSQLTALKIENCDSLRYIFTISMAKALVELSSLAVKCCENVEKIVATCEGEREDKELGQLFSAYFSVKLKYLPNLICFGPEEDCSKFLTAKNLNITVICCSKYRGPEYVDDT